MSRNFRDTKQRSAILSTLCEHGHPMTAKQIRDKAATQVPSLGIATVYRNIRNLLEEKLVEQIDVPGITTCYALPRSRRQALAVCKVSRQMHFIEADSIKQKALKCAPDGFVPEAVELFIFGRFTDATPYEEAVGE